MMAKPGGYPQVNHQRSGWVEDESRGLWTAGPRLSEWLAHDGAHLVSEATERRDWFLRLDVNAFSTLIAEVNAIVRGRPVGKAAFSKEALLIGSWFAPVPADRHPLIDRLLVLAQTLASDLAVTDREALARVAVLVGGGLVYIHPFDDGNGRTSRVISYLIAEGFTHDPKSVETIDRIVWKRDLWGTNPEVLDKALLDAVRRECAPHLAGQPLWWKWRKFPHTRNRDDLTEPLLSDHFLDAFYSSLRWDAMHAVAERHGFAQDMPRTATDSGKMIDVQPIVDQLVEPEVAQSYVDIEAALRVRAIEIYLHTMTSVLSGDRLGVDHATIRISAMEYINRWRDARTEILRSDGAHTGASAATRLVERVAQRRAIAGLGD